MSDELRAKVEAAAEASGRSLNAELITRLEQTFGSEGLRLVRGETQARVMPYRDKLLVMLGTDSPDIPIELTLGAEELKELLAFFGLLGWRKKK